MNPNSQMQKPTKVTTLTVLRVFSGIDLLRTTIKGQGVRTVQKPWKNQATKKSKGFFFISQKRESKPFYSTLLKRQMPSLSDQIPIIPPAMPCMKLMLLLVASAMIMVERQVKLPVRSQNISLLQIAEGTNTMICTARQQALSSQIRGTPNNCLDSRPVAQDRAVTRPATRTTPTTFWIIINMNKIQSGIEIPAPIEQLDRNGPIYLQLPNQLILTAQYTSKSRFGGWAIVGFILLNLGVGIKLKICLRVASGTTLGY